MPYYDVYYRYVDRSGKLRRDHTLRIPASNKEEAKRIVIRGEKPKSIAVDRVVKR